MIYTFRLKHLLPIKIQIKCPAEEDKKIISIY